jgi:hypothetical protein
MCGLLLASLRAQFDAQTNEMSSVTAHATRFDRVKPLRAAVLERFNRRRHRGARSRAGRVGAPAAALCEGSPR